MSGGAGGQAAGRHPGVTGGARVAPAARHIGETRQAVGGVEARPATAAATAAAEWLQVLEGERLWTREGGRGGEESEDVGTDGRTDGRRAGRRQEMGVAYEQTCRRVGGRSGGPLGGRVGGRLGGQTGVQAGSQEGWQVNSQTIRQDRHSHPGTLKYHLPNTRPDPPLIMGLPPV